MQNIYIIGDVQGCFNPLQSLLQKINFNPLLDQLGFVGDLVNRGPKSLETLRLIMQLKNPLIVLGNHDLHLLALYFLPNQFSTIPHTMQDILAAPDCDQLIDFLLQKSFIIFEHFLMVHAGIPPQWSINDAIDYAREAEDIMRKNPKQFFENLYGDNPAVWHKNLTGWDRTRYIVNALTRMRFCTQTGILDLNNKTAASDDPTFRPWFEWINPDCDIYFGHWASLNGQCHHPRIFALDTGCAWGGSLTAIRIQDKKIWTF